MLESEETAECHGQDDEEDAGAGVASGCGWRELEGIERCGVAVVKDHCHHRRRHQARCRHVEGHVHHAHVHVHVDGDWEWFEQDRSVLSFLRGDRVLYSAGSLLFVVSFHWEQN